MIIRPTGSFTGMGRTISVGIVPGGGGGVNKTDNIQSYGFKDQHSTSSIK